MDDNYIIKSFVKMKITELQNELKVANRNWKSNVQGQLQSYEDIQKMLEVQDEANNKLTEINIDKH